MISIYSFYTENILETFDISKNPGQKPLPGIFRQMIIRGKKNFKVLQWKKNVQLPKEEKDRLVSKNNCVLQEVSQKKKRENVNPPHQGIKL